MERPFPTDQISEIHEADTLFQSQYTDLTHTDQAQTSYQDHRSYARNVLSSWGMQLGDLPFSKDNESTLHSLLEMISYRQKDIQFRFKIKDDIAALQYERDKFRSFWEQGQRTLEDCTKKLGRIENQNSQLRLKTKKYETQTKKEREDDKKMISMLRNKNEQILHQIKKKQQEVNRIKEQMKKSVGERNNSTAKNTFEIFQNLQAVSPMKKGGSHNRSEDDKYTFLLERNERQLSTMVKQNALLRDKIFEIRDELVNFNRWVDRQLFGEVEESRNQRAYNHKFFINHNFIFRKESLLREMIDLLDVTKDGIMQLKEMFKNNGGVVKNIKSFESIRSQEDIEELSFKKKNIRQDPKTDRVSKNSQSEGLKEEPRMQKAGTNKKIEFISSENQTPRSMKVIQGKQPPQPIKNVTKSIKGKPVETKITEVTQNRRIFNQNDQNNESKSRQRAVGKLKSQGSLIDDNPFEDELLSDVGQSHNSSIISHIEVDQMGKSKFDKWQILYQQDIE